MLDIYREGRARRERRASLQQYITSGYRPWSQGYDLFKEKYIYEVLSDSAMLERFALGQKLPKRFGHRLDERVVEYPWLVSRLPQETAWLLDAGSALNYLYVVELPVLREKKIVIYNLSPGTVICRDSISYIYGDLRETILKGGSFDLIVCISTLEHVGMNNTMLYSTDERYREQQRQDYLKVLQEFQRLLKPGGRFFLTVPYGRYEDHGWLQQFNHEMVRATIDAFGTSAATETYFRYTDEGWQLAEESSCRENSYFDIHSGTGYDSDYAAAARSVACLEMKKG